MRRLTGSVGVITAAVMLLLAAAPASGQSPSGAIASGSVAAAVDGGGTNVSFGGSLGYRFNRVIGMGVELTWMRLKAASPSDLNSPYIDVSYSDQRSDALFFTTNVRVEIPTTSRRILPYAVGGGGLGSTNTSYTIRTRVIPPPILGPLTAVIIPTPIPPFDMRTATTTSTGLGLTLGGGVSLLATDHFSVDIDLRTFYIRGNQGGSIGRFGAGASWRF